MAPGGCNSPRPIHKPIRRHGKVPVNQPNIVHPLRGLFKVALASAMLATLVLYSTTAMAADAPSFEAEAATRGTFASSVADSSASAGRTLKYTAAGTATKQITVADEATSIVVRARGPLSFDSRAILEVKLDGVTKFRKRLTSNSYERYVAATTIPAGTHTIGLKADNVTKSRTLYADVVTLPAQAAAPTTWQGVATGSVIDGASPTLQQEYRNKYGAEPELVEFFRPWKENGYVGFGLGTTGGIDNMIDNTVARGNTPVLTWVPRDNSDPNGSRGCQPSMHLKQDILAGDHDAFLRGFARDAATHGKPFVIRFAHEMNGSWESWAPGNGGTSAGCPAGPGDANPPAQTEQDYRLAFQHVVSIFKAQGADNVKFFWCPDSGGNTNTTLAGLYPGNAYVDFVGVDAYNRGSSPSSPTWEDLPELINGPSNNPGNAYDYDKITRTIAPGKPFIIGETGTLASVSGADKSQWYRDMFAAAKNYPKLVGIIQFNKAYGSNDWTIDHPASAGTAYREQVTKPEHRKDFAPYLTQ